MFQAVLKNYRQSPRKVRLLADLVKGCTVQEAVYRLQFANKRAAEPLAKLIRSAQANAQSRGGSAEALTVAEIRVDEGPTLKRIRPRAQGRAYMVRKRTSHVKVILKEATAASVPETAKAA